MTETPIVTVLDAVTMPNPGETIHMADTMSETEFAIPPEHAATLVDPKAYADGRIYNTYKWLRENNPVGLANPVGYAPFWVITKYADVRSISRDSKAFPYGELSSVLHDIASDDLIKKMSGGKPYLARSLVQMDAPDHMKYRLLTQSWFMPKNLKTLDGQIGAIVDKTLEKLAGFNGRCDFVSDIALYYPLEIIMEVIGVPKEDLPFMLRLTQEIFAPLDPSSMPEGVSLDDPGAFGLAFQSTMSELEGYFKKLTEDRRRNPRNDIASVIANAKIGDKPLPEMDELGYYAILATAGHDTTSASTAAAMYALATQPDLLARLKAEPALIPILIEEAIRWNSPVKTFMRSVAQDVEFNGRHFKAGDWIMLCYASANRDEAVYEDGDSFSIDRPKIEHMAFGYGPHNCLGQHLGRQEMRVLYEKLIPRLKSVELTGAAEYSQSFFVNGLNHLPIEFALEA